MHLPLVSPFIIFDTVVFDLHSHEVKKARGERKKRKFCLSKASLFSFSDNRSFCSWECRLDFFGSFFNQVKNEHFIFLAKNLKLLGATQGLLTGSQTRVLGAEQGQSADWITTVTGYDTKGRVVYTATDNPLLDVVETQSHQLDFVGRITQTTTTHKKGGTALSWTDDFTYDVNGRMLKQTQTLDDKTETIVARCYNPLGQLNRKTLGGMISILS